MPRTINTMLDDRIYALTMLGNSLVHVGLSHVAYGVIVSELDAVVEYTSKDTIRQTVERAFRAQSQRRV